MALYLGVLTSGKCNVLHLIGCIRPCSVSTCIVMQTWRSTKYAKTSSCGVYEIVRIHAIKDYKKYFILFVNGVKVNAYKTEKQAKAAAC